MSASFQDALGPLTRHLLHMVREHEILRVIGWIPSEDKSKAADTAIDEILKWEQKGSSSELLSEAWDRNSFDHNLCGCNSDGIRLQFGSSDFWAIRVDDTYYFDRDGRRFSAAWHVKTSDNTRDPVRCLRIYYCFDSQMQRIIVSEMLPTIVLR